MKRRFFRSDLASCSAGRPRTFNTLLLSEDLEIPSDEAFATVQPSKGTSKVYSRGLSFFEGLDSPRSFGSAAFFFSLYVCWEKRIFTRFLFVDFLYNK